MKSDIIENIEVINKRGSLQLKKNLCLQKKNNNSLEIIKSHPLFILNLK